MIKIERTHIRYEIDLAGSQNAHNVNGIVLAPEYSNLNPFSFCDDFVFKVLKNKPWTPDDKKLFAVEPLRLLDLYGFQETNLPLRAGDIVLYACETVEEAHPIVDDNDVTASWMQKNAKPPFVTHVGMFEKSNVVSRFGRSKVYRHPIDHVPSYYGTEVYFFRET